MNNIIYDLIKPGGWMTLFVPSIGYIQRCAPSHHVIYLMFVHEFWNIFGGILIYSNIPRQGILAIYKVLENPRMRIGPVVYVLNGLLIEFFSPSTGLPIASPCFAPVQSNAKHHNTGRYK